MAATTAHAQLLLCSQPAARCPLQLLLSGRPSAGGCFVSFHFHCTNNEAKVHYIKNIVVAACLPADWHCYCCNCDCLPLACSLSLSLLLL